MKFTKLLETFNPSSLFGSLDMHNEYVDSLTRKAPSFLISQWISQEDLLLFMKNYMQEEAKNEWKNSKYYHEFHFLNENRPQLRIFPSSRKNDLLISRFRTKTYPTSAKPFRFRLASTSLCTLCKVEETLEHLLFQCQHFEHQRNFFMRRWAVSHFLFHGFLISLYMGPSINDVALGGGS
ncbi:hypothetical protein AVEN_47601-1 [Araneus ventricosus]|uniref:Reverse transcriptase zinc-binding domain-containing protein n=1 Tax=Araneus ventricosus TaxID=182803 RepID=A0A4Y2DK89_ARAVE|nr:hypothetical protein AVEN_47601-1 [Araneus ventricosus]